MSEMLSRQETVEGKRVLIVFCSLEFGGAERQGLHLAKYLKEQGCDVRVWSTQAGHGPVVEYCEEMGVSWEVHRFRWPCRKSSLLRDGWKFLWALWRMRPDAIVPYTGNPNVGCGLLWHLSPVRACLWGQRNVHELRGDAVERWAYKRVSAVVCNAEHEVGYMRRKLGETPAPFVVIPNGIQLEPPEKDRAQWRRELKVESSAVVVTMVANFREQKDHPTLLRAWQDVLVSFSDPCAPPHLMLAGTPQTTHASVLALAQELGELGKSVHVLGQVKDVTGLLAASDIGVLCSQNEGLSNATLEYMASGLPVLVTDLPGNREALGEGCEQQLVLRGDVEQLAARLQILIKTPALRQQLGEQNQRRARSEFSINGMCSRTVGMIESLLQRRN